MKIGDSYLDAYYAYYGAYVDGEGHIGIKKVHTKKHQEKGFSPTYSERVSVASVNKLIIESFNDIVVGHIFYHKEKGASRGYWSWEVTDRKAVKFLEIIKPYLKVKRLQADVVLALTRVKNRNNRNRIPLENLKLRDDLYRIMKELHASC